MAVFAGASPDDGQIVDIAVALLAEESDLAGLDALGDAAVLAAAPLASPVLDADLRLTFGFGVNVDVAKHDLAAGGRWKNTNSESV